jgi:hypothetical protein
MSSGRRAPAVRAVVFRSAIARDISDLLGRRPPVCTRGRTGQTFRQAGERGITGRPSDEGRSGMYIGGGVILLIIIIILLIYLL